jgi:hypothetical protein
VGGCHAVHICLKDMAVTRDRARAVSGEFRTKSIFGRELPHLRYRCNEGNPVSLWIGQRDNYQGEKNLALDVSMYEGVAVSCS